MTLLTATQITKKFKDQVILDKASFTILSGQRLALVGKNGIGKSTLLEIMAGKQSPDSGTIVRTKACIVDYIEQEKNEYLGMSLFDFVADARAYLIKMRHQISDLEHYLEESPHDAKQLERLGDLQHEYEQRDGFSFDSQISAVLDGLGFKKNRYADRLQNFSGGERNRAGLARLLAGQGNLLLLDEPTNHLDIESTAWLEDYLRDLDKAIVIVSHDRTFLGATTQAIWEMAYGKIEKYTGGIEKYLVDRVARRELAEHKFRHQQEEIKRIEEFIRRNMAGQKTKQAQSRLKYLGRIKRLAAPRVDGSGPSIEVKSSGRSYAHVLALDKMAVGYGSEPVVKNISLDVYRGDKIGLIGRNGSGKSTLLKTLIGELAPVSGSLSLGSNVDVAYFDQGLSDLSENQTVLDNIWSVDPTAEPGPLRAFLARFGFSGEDVFKLVKMLSGGEKTKVCLARLLYHPANLVILDEPTNHLDMPAREALESALQEYDGSCLIVSHDRFFLNQVVNRIVHFQDGRVKIYDGNYSDFLARSTAGATSGASQSPTSKGTFKQKTERQQDNQAFRERSKELARREKKISAVKQQIETAEAALVAADLELRHTANTDDWQHLQKLTEQKQQCEDAILNLYDELERREKSFLD